ncbi:peptidyl-prolyl cis-trans isomerase CYP21-4-like isoform X2 [Mangifera indica]|uniref:peptidyl-prolyl cis-trans isomerase CYP21-4-like isoform X2 n=1 Tax=Mangifera indica TaxID=29780 RepID=UPI001CFB3961|nr:peptidyl-prolyl cis-trans isomerase CYP21-4-like isoform X2 [Mangifera indica]
MARIKPQALLLQSKKKKGPNRISFTTIIAIGSILVLALFFLFSTYRHWSQRPTFQTEVHKSVVEDNNSFMDSKKSDLPGYAIISTSKGSITVDLFKDSSPEVVDEFIDLCEKGHFNGMLFRHIIKHYVIQAGNIDKMGSIEDWTVKGKHYSQLDTSLKHDAFMLGTSKIKHDNQGFELFITTTPMPDLNEKLIVFGRVIKGEEVVQWDDQLRS